MTPSDAKGFEWVGSAIALDGDRMIMGGFYGNAPPGPTSSGSGSAYIFERSGTTWTQAAKLTGNNLSSSVAYFGWSVAIDTSTVAVGAPTIYTGPGLTENGKVEIYTRGPAGKWSYQTSIILASPGKYDRLGSSLSLGGTTLVIGAPGDWARNNGSQAGSVYVYSGSGSSWTQSAKLDPSDGVVHDLFGYSVSRYGNVLVAGAPGAAVGTTVEAGAAYVFVQSAGSWSQQAKLVAPDGATSDTFGYSVAAASEDTVVVGAAGARKLYKFTRSGTTWSHAATYTACNNGAIGASLAASGNLAVSAATAAWVFDLADPNTSCVAP